MHQNLHLEIIIYFMIFFSNPAVLLFFRIPFLSKHEWRRGGFGSIVITSLLFIIVVYDTILFLLWRNRCQVSACFGYWQQWCKDVIMVCVRWTRGRVASFLCTNQQGVERDTRIWGHTRQWWWFIYCGWQYNSIRRGLSL
jgi:hypothetical protein